LVGTRYAGAQFPDQEPYCKSTESVTAKNAGIAKKKQPLGASNGYRISKTALVATFVASFVEIPEFDKGFD
jgi:hypothetical protein